VVIESINPQQRHVGLHSEFRVTSWIVLVLLDKSSEPRGHTN
jgi:hypothetical protein